MTTNKLKNIIIIGILLAISILYKYFIMDNNVHKNLLEGLTTIDGKLRCPNTLIQIGSKYYLYNSNVAKVPGVNPIEFNTLEDYTSFLEWQRSVGIRCPVLYVQNTFDAQGNQVFKVRPSAIEPQGGLPPLSEDKHNFMFTDINNNMTEVGMDVSAHFDKIDEQNKNMLYSPNPMDTNWGGAKYTQELVDQGYYDGNNVSIRVA